MKILRKNLLKLDEKKATKWLESLGDTLEVLKQQWALKNIEPVNNMTWNYVAKATSKAYGDVCLKVGMQVDTIRDEFKALNHFCGQGMIRVHDYSNTYNALLIEQAIPGTTLKSLYPPTEETAIESYAAVVQEMKKNAKDCDNFKHLSYWLRVFDDVNEDDLPAGLLSKGKILRQNLLNAEADTCVLHGDLHLDNILSHKNDWVAIDPKGIRGPLAFDVACFDFVTDDELLQGNKAKELYLRRLHKLSNMLNLGPVNLQEWVFMRLLLGACWMIQDKGNPMPFLDRISIFYE